MPVKPVTKKSLVKKTSTTSGGSPLKLDQTSLKIVGIGLKTVSDDWADPDAAPQSSTVFHSMLDQSHVAPVKKSKKLEKVLMSLEQTFCPQSKRSKYMETYNALTDFGVETDLRVSQMTGTE